MRQHNKEAQIKMIQGTLNALKEEFDPHYERSDDHKVWAYHRDLKEDIKQVESDLARAKKELQIMLYKKEITAKMDRVRKIGAEIMMLEDSINKLEESL